MREALLDKVRPETLDALLDALADVTEEIKAAEPDADVRYNDYGYGLCLEFNGAVFGALRRQVLKRRGEKIEDNPEA